MKKQFKGKPYDYQIIIESISLYYHFFLSYHDCAKIMGKFSINIHHTTIYRWCQQYGKVLYHLWENEISANLCLNLGGLIRLTLRLEGKIVTFIVRLIPMEIPLKELK